MPDNKRPIDGAPWVLLDWGDTVMVNFPHYPGPMNDWPEVAACPGIEDALAALAENYNLALATNAQDSEATDIHKALARVGLGNVFDKIFCSQARGHLKPSPGVFQQVIQKLVVWYNPSGGEFKTGTGYTTITHLRELEGALRLF
jgi:FMN phosphatase YigB (HAD superfamily)